MKAGKYFIIALAVIVVDQITKVIVKLNMELGDSIPIIGDLFKIHFIENKGAAFGLTVGHLLSVVGITVSPETSKLILSLFSIVAVIAIGYVLYKMTSHRSPLPLFVALIFGGAMGNIIDRTFYGVFFESINQYEGGLFHGRVVDMFYFDIWRGYLPNWVPFAGGTYYSLWPIFNIADSAISVGIVVILFFQGKFFSMDEKAKEEELASTNKVLEKSQSGSSLSSSSKDGNDGSKESKESSASDNRLAQTDISTPQAILATSNVIDARSDKESETNATSNAVDNTSSPSTDNQETDISNEVSQSDKGSSNS